ncbi:MAG: hypothetical protein K2J90_13880 [Lachnospiraceae bacterium]|nr:hypothetical protein [Lachnospiraceae bacterium]
MRKSIIHFVWMLMVIILLSFSAGSVSHAYTEEEIQQAKAWLSAHGYSPDAGGASQAYQDYLDGKFDEELGINTTEQVTTGVTEETSQESSEKITETHQKEEKEKTGRNEETSPGSIRGSDSGETEIPDIEAAEGQVVSKTEDSAGEEPKESNLESDVSQEKKQEITLYQKKNQDTYREAGMMVTLSVLLMVVLKGVILLLK